MKRYLRQILLFFSPLLLLLALYIPMDPFKVVFSHDVYYRSGQPDYVVLNRGYVSTETFAQQYDRQQYNAFIFGNSRSIFWRVSDWKRHLPQAASPFHFDGSDESLYNLHKKVMYLGANDVDIAHAIIVADYSLFYRAEERGAHLLITPPRLVGYSNIAAFHGSFLLAYLDPHFLLAYYDFMLTGQFRDYMRDHNVLNAEPMHYDRVTNEISYPQFEEAIAEGSFYDAAKRERFRRRSSVPPPSPPCLGASQRHMLKEMQEVFAADSTELRIVISPLYNQRPLNPKDVQSLREIFGESCVANYSGVNDITEDYRNYYELSHYRPRVAARIMQEMY
ncbi:hypothetical protein KQI65_03420 [bacterium]|nr:hypothetical protein [bacterium]